MDMLRLQLPRTRLPLRSVLPSLALALWAITMSNAVPAQAQEAAGLAKRLAELRAEVETLSAQLADAQQQRQDELRSYARQKAELELEQQREQTRLQKLRQAVGERQKRIATERASGDRLEPLFGEQLAALRSYVRSSLPFRTSERAAELDKIEDQWKSGLLTPQRAIMRLWTFVEDEFRMTRENGLYRQTIELDGREQLADVVRVGTVSLYFRTSDDRVGHAARDDADSAWTYVETSTAEDRRRILSLFDTFKKQIRVGYFELPNALPKVQQP